MFFLELLLWVLEAFLSFVLLGTLYVVGVFVGIGTCYVLNYFEVVVLRDARKADWVIIFRRVRLNTRSAGGGGSVAKKRAAAKRFRDKNGKFAERPRRKLAVNKPIRNSGRKR